MKNGKLSDVLGELQALVKGYEEGHGDGGDGDHADVVAAQITGGNQSNMDVEVVDINIVPNTVRRLLDFVGQTQNETNKFSSPIYKAPSNFRDLSPSSFTPRVVSIGPFHSKNKNLQRFEVRKATFMHDLLCRRLCASPTQTLTSCVQKVTSMIKKIKESYAYNNFSSDMELAQMMVTDACFILEFILEMPKDSNLSLQDQHIPYDLVLLENQIPFFVLEGVYECTIHNLEEYPSLAAFIRPLLNYINLFELQGRIKVGRGHPYTNHDHILSYLYHCYQPAYDDIPLGLPHSTIHSASKLDQAGVNFKPHQDAEWPMAMKIEWSRYCSSIFMFSMKPTLTMPILRINDFTELVLRNLITYEQSYALYPYVTSYARAMDMLIDDQEDIAKLVASKVVVNHIGSNEEAAKMINNICKEVAPEHFYYSQQWIELDEHFNKYWPSMMVKLKQTYFNSPWTIIALIGGIILFGLTLVQTIFAVKSS